MFPITLWGFCFSCTILPPPPASSSLCLVLIITTSSTHHHRHNTIIRTPSTEYHQHTISNTPPSYYQEGINNAQLKLVPHYITWHTIVHVLLLISMRTWHVTHLSIACWCCHTAKHEHLKPPMLYLHVCRGKPQNALLQYTSPAGSSHIAQDTVLCSHVSETVTRCGPKAISASWWKKGV